RQFVTAAPKIQTTCLSCTVGHSTGFAAVADIRSHVSFIRSKKVCFFQYAAVVGNSCDTRVCLVLSRDRKRTSRAEYECATGPAPPRAAKELGRTFACTLRRILLG